MHSCTSTSPVDIVQAKNSYICIHKALQKGPNHAHPLLDPVDVVQAKSSYSIHIALQKGPNHAHPLLQWIWYKQRTATVYT